MAQATLIKDNNKVVVESGSQEAQNYFSQGYSLMNKQTEQAQPIQPTQAPQSVAIDGAKFNTKETQQANFTNIQPVGNTLYGIPKAPVVPNVIPQTDLNNALSPETSAKTSATAQGFIGFNEKQVADLNKAYQRQVAGTATETDIKNIKYAQDKGWQPTETTEVQALAPSTSDLLFEKYSNLSAIKSKAKQEAMKDLSLDEKSQNIAISQSVVNQLRTDLQNQGILDIKEQDVIRSKPILTAQIAGQLNELSREQKLDAMILQNNYNNALVELQIAEGNYDRAREIVKETADDAYNIAKEEIEALRFKMDIEEVAADKMTKELEYERDLSLEGYVHIKSPEGLKGLKESDIYRDPVSNKVYMKPEPTISRVMEVNGRSVGLDDKGNIVRDFGAVSGGGGGGGGSTPTVIPGVDTTNMTPAEIKALETKIKEFNNDLNKELEKLARGGDWGASWNYIKNKYPTMTNQEVDEALNAWQYNPQAENNQDGNNQEENQTIKPVGNNKEVVSGTPDAVDWTSFSKQWQDTKKYLGIK
jgi:hypothetical protein